MGKLDLTGVALGFRFSPVLNSLGAALT